MAKTGSPAIKALEDEIAAVEKAQEPTQKQIAELQAALVEGQEIVARNRAAIDVLTGKTSVRAPSRARAPRAQSRSEDREMAIAQALPGSEGMNGTELAELLGVTPTTARKTLEAMVEAGTIKRTGSRRGTKYFSLPKNDEGLPVGSPRLRSL